MPEIPSWLGAVWSPVAFLNAVIGGMGLGALIRYAAFRDPLVRTMGFYATLTTAMALVAGGLFYSGQIAETFMAGDPWERVSSRFSLWVVFSITTGFTLWLLLPRRKA